jgi:hypothetical protein
MYAKGAFHTLSSKAQGPYPGTIAVARTNDFRLLRKLHRQLLVEGIADPGFARNISEEHVHFELGFADVEGSAHVRRLCAEYEQLV